jgi:hypothetical protein
VDAGSGGRRAHRGDRRRQRGVVVRGPDVAGDDHDRAGGQQRQRGGDAARGLQRLGLARPGEADAERGDVAVPGAGEGLDLVDDQRLAAERQQRLRAGVGERPHPFAASGGEDHRGGDARHQNV